MIHEVDPSRWRRVLPYALLAGLVLLLWGQTVKFGFVWDDMYFIEDLQSIRSLKHVPEMFYSLDAQSSYPKGFVLFRPLRTLHYAVLCALGGGEPRPSLFHLANVLWHAAAAILFFRLMRQVFSSSTGGNPGRNATGFALLGAVAFAAHPVVSEVVCWAKSLDDIMATVFVLAACHRLLLWQPQNEASRPHFWWGLGYFVLAMYSKESAVPFALFLVVLFHFFKRMPLQNTLRSAVPFFAAALIFVVHRHLVIGRTSQTAPISGSYVQTLIDTLPAAPIYLRLLAGFPPFHIDYSFMKTGQALTTPAVLAGLALAIAMPVATLFALRRNAIVAGAALAWLGLFLLPFVNLVPMMQFCAERFLYLPLIGWILLLTWLLQKVTVTRLAAVIGVTVTVCWAGIAWNRSWIWEDRVTLFVQSHLQGPTTANIRQNAVGSVLRLPHLQKAFVSVQVPGALPRIHLQAPEVLRQADWPAIERTLDELHRILPNDPCAATALAITKAQLRKLPEAVALFELAAREQPEDPDARCNLGTAYVEAGELAKGETVFREVLARNPSHLGALKSLSSLFWRQKNYEAARPLFEKLRELDPSDASADYWLKQIPNAAGAGKGAGESAR